MRWGIVKIKWTQPGLSKYCQRRQEAKTTFFTGMQMRGAVSGRWSRDLPCNRPYSFTMHRPYVLFNLLVLWRISQTHRASHLHALTECLKELTLVSVT